MRGKLSTAGAVLSGLCAFKLCCVLPSVFSLLGLAGSGAALAATRWVSLALLGVSILLMGRSFYTIYVLKCGSRASRWVTWISAAALVVIWTIRLERPAQSSAPVPSGQGAAAPKAAPHAGAAEKHDTCPCRRQKGGAS